MECDIYFVLCVILASRSYGSCAILLYKKMSDRFAPVQVKSLSKHVCSIMLTLHKNYKLLIIYAYFPTDPGTVTYSNAKLCIVLAIKCQL